MRMRKGRRRAALRHLQGQVMLPVLWTLLTLRKGGAQVAAEQRTLMSFLLVLEAALLL